MAFVYWVHTSEMTDMWDQGYIGYTGNTVKDRFRSHKKMALSKGVYPIHNAIRKYGNNLIVTTVLEGSPEYCLSAEKALRPLPNTGWNIAIGGDAPMMGKKHSEETIAKMIARKIGHKHSESTLEAMCVAQQKVVKSEEFISKLIERNKQGNSEITRLKISQSRLGILPSEETKQKWSENRKGEGNSFFGKTHSDESRKKISEAAKARMAISPWTHPTAKATNWCRAIELYELYTQHKGLTEAYLRKLSKVDFKFPSMHRKFSAGWNPSEDNLYMAWLANYNKQQKELHESTQSS